MESVAFIGEELSSSSMVKCYSDFKLDGKTIRTGLVNDRHLSLNTSYELDSVLVKKKAFSCNFRDKPLVHFVAEKIKESTGQTYFSHIGSEFVGEVIEVGEKVKDLKPGDRVIPNISYPTFDKSYKPGVISNGASKRFELFKQNKLIKIDNVIPDEVLAAFPVAAFTAYGMIRKVVRPKAKILITAAKSNTSLAVINALQNHDVRVYAITTSKEHYNRFINMGVEDVFIVQPNKLEFDSRTLSKILSIGPFDAVIDPFFDLYFSKVIGLLGMDGKYITCGLQNQLKEAEDKILEVDLRSMMINLMIKNVSIIGNCIGLLEDGLKALDDFKLGKFNIEIDRVYGKGEEALFFERTFNSSSRFGKVVYKYED